MELPREYPVTELARFHGHLGPFIVLGYRMGRYALQKLGDNPFALKASVYCSGITPQSCLADGIQLGSGCTLGKGNIEIVKSDAVYSEFSSDGAKIRLKPLGLKQLPQDTPDYELEIEKYAADLYTLPDDQLFSVEVLS
jgi:formylmethanofuran dehydrogenase subunit E